MALMHLDFNPSEKKLRQFGAAALVMLTVMGLLFGLKFDWPWSVISGFITAGAVIFVLSLISAKLVRPIYIALVAAGYPIGWAVSHILMAVFFYGIITPLALVFRLFGRDALNRNYKSQQETYWQDYPRADSVKRYFKQF